MTLFILTDRDNINGLIDTLGVGELERNVTANPFVDVVTFKEGWANSFELGGARQIDGQVCVNAKVNFGQISSQL